MIRNDAELENTRRLLKIAEDAYADLRADLLPDKPKAFELLSQGYKSEIAGLTEAIHGYLDIPTYRLPENAELALRLKGRDAELGKLAAATVGESLKHFETGVTNIAIAQLESRSRTAVTNTKKACRFPLAGVGPGSVVLYLGEPPLPAGVLFDTGSQQVARDAVSHLKDGIRFCSEKSAETRLVLANDFDQNAFNLQLCKAVASILPSDAAVTSVELIFPRAGDQLQPDRLEVTRDVAHRAKELAKQIAKAGVRTTEVGTIRRVDLDKRGITLRNRDGDPKPLEATFPLSLFATVLGMLNKRAKLTGVIKTHGKRQRMEIEKVEPEDPPEQKGERAIDL